MAKVRIRKGPIGISLVLSTIVSIAFYFVNNSIETLASAGELARGYVELLSVAKWLIVLGVLVKGFVSGISLQSTDDL